MESNFKTIIDNHKQLYTNSCISSAIELVLKLMGVVDQNYYKLQKQYNNRVDLSFANFSKTIQGIKFEQKFCVPRDQNFPFDKLFAEIDNRINKRQFTIISLQNMNNYHMFVITDKLENGEYRAFSKNMKNTLERNTVMSDVHKMNGTDILIYE